MRIGELMARAGVSRDTVRHYEAIGLLHAAHFTRRANGYRDYNAAAVDRIAFIKKGQRAGFTLSQIAKVADDWEHNEMSLAEKREILSKQLVEIDRRIDDLEALKAEILSMLAGEAL